MKNKILDHPNALRKTGLLPINSEVTIADYDRVKLYDGFITGVFLGADQDQVFLVKA